MSAALQSLFKTALKNLIAEQNSVQVLLDQMLSPHVDRRGYEDPWEIRRVRPGEHSTEFEVMLMPPGDRHRITASGLENIREKTGASHVSGVVVDGEICILLSWRKAEEDA